ncbi:adhesin HecA-like repeat protein [Pseudomonas sp. 3296]|uniref:hypothetical protein n=1 Tax=Pseudomonas sp. 3296 TaxID=2817753 RepID=UPI00285A5E82|nr:hypothetical protein [Pseudomonas sp. 3296]MDR6919097.1 adhesin HecA-like repeat protein [Pseudomonas sp. 3296]
MHFLFRCSPNPNITLSGGLDNSRGLLSSEALLAVSAANVINRLGSLSSAGQLNIGSSGRAVNW